MVGSKYSTLAEFDFSDTCNKGRNIGFIIGNQILRSGTLVGANYRAACRGRSKKDFISKIGIGIEECDETLYWLEIIGASGIIKQGRLESLMRENNELLAIFCSIMKSSRRNLKAKKL